MIFTEAIGISPVSVTADPDTGVPWISVAMVSVAAAVSMVAMLAVVAVAVSLRSAKADGKEIELDGISGLDMTKLAQGVYKDC